MLSINARIMADDKKSVTIETHSGEVNYTGCIIRDQTDFDETITELTSDDLSALERDMERIPLFIEAFEAFVFSEDRSGRTLKELDLAFAEWFSSGGHDEFTSEDVVRIVGCGLGDHAIRQLGVRWARVTDKYGSDIALVAEEPPMRSFVFPAVRYCIEDKQTDFIEALFRGIEHIMKDAAK